MTNFNEELRKTSHVAAAWETAFQALDYALKESALHDMLAPSDPEVIMLKEFVHGMQEREAGVIQALNNVRAALPKDYVIESASGRGTSRYGRSGAWASAPRRARRGN